MKKVLLTIILSLVAWLVNINLEANASTCPTPTNVTVSNITATSVTITTTCHGYSNFILYYRAKGLEAYDTLYISSPYELTELKIGTQYEGIIRTDCGSDDENTATYNFNFATECASLTLPWSFGAECDFIIDHYASDSHPYCWANINNASAEYYWRAKTGDNAYNGEKGIYFGGLSSVPRIHDDWLITPSITFTGNDEISFWAKTITRNVTEDYQGHFMLYASTDQATSNTDIEHFAPLNIIGNNVTNNTINIIGEEWTHYIIKLPNTLVGEHHLAFAINNIFSFDFCLDDINIYPATNCYAPHNIVAKSVLSTQASITWSGDALAYNVYYGAPGFRLENAQLLTVYDTTIELFDLLPHTTYECIIEAICDGDITSAPSTPITFHTTYPPIHSDQLPLIEDFSDNNIGRDAPLDNGWYKYSNNTSEPFPYINSAKGNGNPNSLYFNNASYFYSYVALPEFEDNFEDLVLSCSVHRAQYSKYKSALILGVMSNQRDISTFTPYDTLSPELYAEWTNYQIPLDHFDTEKGKFIAFVLPMSNDYGYIYLDNIRIDLRSTCEFPTYPIAQQVTSNSATISWVDSISNSWTVYYGPKGFSLNGVYSQEEISNNSITLTGLTPQTEYECFIQSHCDVNDSSIPSKRVDFKTTCNAIASLPYSEDFESYRSNENAPINPCWIKQALGDYFKEYPFPSSSSAIHGSRGLEFRATESQTSKYNCYVAMPLFNRPITELKLQCNMKNMLYENSSSNEYHSTMALGVMGNPYDLSTFDTLQIFDMSNMPNGTVLPIESTFYHYNGMGKYIAFLATDVDRGNHYSSDNIFYLDDIIISPLSGCPRPSNLVATEINDTNILLTWEGNSASYEVIYSQHADMSDSTVIICNSNTIELSNLTTFTHYYINVRGICEDGASSEWMLQPLQITTILNCGTRFVNLIDSIGNATTTSSVYSLNGNAQHSTTTTWNIFQINELHDMGFIGDSTFIRSINLHANTVGAPLSFSIYMAPTPLDEFNQFIIDTLELSKMTLVYEGTMPFIANNWNEIILQQPYLYSDTANLLIAFVRNGVITSSTEFFCSSYEQFLTVNHYHSTTTARQYRSDIKFNICTQLPTCTRPEYITATDISATEINLSWNESGNSYQIAYAPESFNPNDTVILPWETTITNSCTLQNLTPNTLYTIYIRTLCGNEYSIWSRALKVRTSCAKTALPITYNFEEAEVNNNHPIPPCFYRLNNADLESYQTNPFIDNDATYAHSGTKTLKFSISQYSGYPEQMAFVFPAIDTTNYPMQNNQMSFWGRSYAGTTQLVVGITSNPNDISTFTPIETLTFNNQYTEYTISFSNYTGNGEYPTILANRPRNYQNTYIDDVLFEEIPSCPRAYDLLTLSTTDNSATITWTDTNNAPQWIIDYTIAESDDTLTLTTLDNPCLLTNLLPDTKYYFNVRPICASGDIASSAKEIGTFHTTQTPVTIPYTYNFEDDTEWSYWGTQSNTNIQWHRGTAIAEQGTHAMYISTDYGNHYATHWDASVNAIAYRDIDFGTDTSSFTLSFKAIAGGIDNPNNNALAIMLVNPTTEILMNQGAPYTPWGNINNIAQFTLYNDTLWHNYELYFEHIAGVHRLVFLWYNLSTSDIPTSMSKAGAIDDIALYEQSCYRPNSLQISNIESSSATLSWMHDASQFQIAYTPTQIANAPLHDTLVNTPNLHITNLEANTEYTIKVRAICNEGDTSGWSNPLPFKTICSRYYAVDTLREDFSLIEGEAYNTAGMLPECWEGYSSNPNGILPHVVDNGIYWYAHGDNALIMTSGYGSYGNISAVRLPYTVEPINTLTLSYWMCTESNYRGTLEVGYLVGHDIENDFVALSTINASETTQHKNPAGNQTDESGYWDTVDFSTAPDNATAIAMRWLFNSSFYSVCIDDIELTSSLTCNPPTITDSTIEEHSATIYWNGNATQYQLRIRPAQIPYWSETYTTTNSTYTFTHLLPATTYIIQLRSYCDEQHTSPWAIWQFTTSEAPCSIPTNLIATDIQYEEATLTWKSPSSPIHYVVNLFNGIENRIDTVSQPTITLTQLYAYTTYHVAVKSLCSTTSASEWSDTLTFTTKDCPIVENVKVNNITTHSATIVWNKANALKWDLIYGVDVDQDEDKIIELSRNYYTLHSLTPNTLYDIYVRGYCAENTFGPWSNKLTFRTPSETQGIDNIANNSQIIIYPNPATHTTTLKIQGVEGPITISIIDMNGIILHNETLECNSHCEKQLNITQLPQGTYFVRIIGDKINSVRKLIIR